MVESLVASRSQIALKPHVINLENIENVATNQKATIKVDTGVTYQGIYLEYRNSSTGAVKTIAQMKSEIDDIELLVGRVPVRKLTVSQLLTLNAFNQVANKDGVIPILFAENRRVKLPEQAGILGMGTAGETRKIQISVKFNATATNPQLNAYGIVIEDGAPMGEIVHYERLNPSLTVSGSAISEEFQNIQLTGKILGLHYFSSTISAVEVTADSVNLTEETMVKEIYDTILETEGGYTPDANVFHVKFDMTGMLGDALVLSEKQKGVDKQGRRVFIDNQLVNNLKTKITHDGTGGQIDQIIERLDVVI